mmetsp:Transcript_55317/g.121308  ORF Transcript_55317/g.121308 Transcript_55317/m.121308 type:complete len:475 (-) Transcript_55317:121-1545(-)
MASEVPEGLAQRLDGLLGASPASCGDHVAADAVPISSAMGRLQDFFSAENTAQKLDKALRVRQGRAGDSAVRPLLAQAVGTADTQAASVEPRALSSCPEAVAVDGAEGDFCEELSENAPEAALSGSAPAPAAGASSAAQPPQVNRWPLDEDAAGAVAAIGLDSALDLHLRMAKTNRQRELKDGVRGGRLGGIGAEGPAGEVQRGIGGGADKPSAGTEVVHSSIFSKQPFTLAIPRLSTDTPRRDSADGADSLRYLHLADDNRQQFQEYAKALTKQMTDELANKNPYIQALSAHRQEISECFNLGRDVVDSLASRMATQRDGALATLAVTEAQQAPAAHDGFPFILCGGPRCVGSEDEDKTCRTRAYDFVLSPRREDTEDHPSSRASTAVPESSGSTADESTATYMATMASSLSTQPGPAPLTSAAELLQPVPSPRRPTPVCDDGGILGLLGNGPADFLKAIGIHNNGWPFNFGS